MRSIKPVRGGGHNDFLKRATHDELLVLIRNLLALVKVLEAENGQLKAENVKLKDENAALREELQTGKRATVPLCQVPAVLRSFTGLSLSQSAITPTIALRGFEVATTLADMLTGRPMPKAPSH